MKFVPVPTTAVLPFTTETVPTTADPKELASPSDLRVVRVSATNVLLQWEPSAQSGVLYRIYAHGNQAVGLTGANTFTPAGRTGAASNCYRVAAVDGQGLEAPRSKEVCARVAGAPTSPPR